MADTTHRKLLRSKFILTAYSLTGAALMGSSIGLVAYQSRQFFFLSRVSRHNLVHPPYHPGQFHPRPHGYGDYGFNHTYGDQPPPPPYHQPPPPPYHQHDQHHQHHHHYFRHPLWSFFLSTCLPVLVWIGTLFLCAMLINSRKWVPKVISARTGNLLSQLMFSVFWIILASIQEVQERLVAQRRSLMELNPIAEAMEDTTHIDVVHEFKERISSLVIPLSTIWYLAVVILGVATGLLTTCSNLLERQLDAEQHEADAILREEQCLMSYEKHDQEKGLIMGSEKCQEAGTTTTTATTVTTTTTTATTSLSRYTGRQRFILSTLVFGLFMSQMRLFKWIIQAQSLAAYHAGTTESVASCLTFVGLVSGTVMISLGVRYLPREREA
ncbi:hypothetical protein BGX26_010796 [Mortierella sp. AD094]|nr:hypothetical protein BGX26_010796 [Mortierella sp. AD094]